MVERRLTYAEHVHIRTVHELEAANPGGALGVDLGPGERKESGSALLLKWANKIGQRRYGTIPQALSILGVFSKIPYLAVIPAFLAAYFLFSLGTAGIAIFMSPVIYTVLYFILRVSVIPAFSRLLAESSHGTSVLLVMARPFLGRRIKARSLPEGLDGAKVFYNQFVRVFARHPRIYFEGFWLVYWLSLSVFVLVLSVFMDFSNMKWEAVQALSTRTDMVWVISRPFPAWARPDLRDVAYLDASYRSRAAMLVVPRPDRGGPWSVETTGSSDVIPLRVGETLEARLNWPEESPPDAVFARQKGRWERLSGTESPIFLDANDLAGGKPPVIAYTGDTVGGACPVRLTLEPGADGGQLWLTAAPDPSMHLAEPPAFLGAGNGAAQYAGGRWFAVVDEAGAPESLLGVRLCHGDTVCDREIRVRRVALAADVLPMSETVPTACKLKWLSFYLWMILVYGVAPRLLTFGQAAWFLRGHRRALDAELNGGPYRRLVERLRGKQIAVSSPGVNILQPIPAQISRVLDVLGQSNEPTLIVDPDPGNAFVKRLTGRPHHETYPEKVGSAPRRKQELFEFLRTHSYKRIIVCYGRATNPDESVVLFLDALHRMSGAAVEVLLCAPGAPGRDDEDRLRHWRAALDEGIDVAWAESGSAG